MCQTSLVRRVSGGGAEVRDMTRWLQAFRQTTTYLGVAVLALIWAGIYLLAGQEHDRAYQDAVRQGGNLNRVLEEYVRRVVEENDDALLALRRGYQGDSQHFDIGRWAAETQSNNSLAIQFSIVGADGFVKQSSIRAVNHLHYVGDRDPFKTQRAATADELYISKPLLGKVTKKYIIYFARRITLPDGAFAGIVVCSIDVAQLEDFLSSLDIGPSGVVALVGGDGVLRARGGPNPVTRTVVGQALPRPSLLHYLKQSPQGSYWNKPANAAPFGGTERLMSYRQLAGVPLIALVGLAKQDIFQHAEETARKYVIAGATLSLMVLIVVFLGAGRQARILATAAELESSKQSLDETRKFLDSIIENIPAAVVVKDAATRRYVLVNRAFEAMLEVPRSELLGRTAFDIHNERDARNIEDADRESVQSGDGVSYKEIELDLLRRGQRMQSTRRIVIRNSQGEAKYLIAVIEDITESKKAEQRIAFLAHHDALTGLANRIALAQKIDEAAARQRRRDEPFTVLLLDLDRFKQVNDTLGHPAGDTLLIEVATRLKSLLRETDVLARLGGDEFAIIQAGETNQREAARSLAERIIAMQARPFAIEGADINIGTSIGIALAPEHGTASDSLLKMADLALYRAKSAGRNGYCFFAPEMSEIASARQEIEGDLRRAIQQNELELHYQPIIDAKTRRICSVEALVRWRHPTKGLISPELFIPLAEEDGLIVPIGDWVLRTACAEAVKWPAEVKVAVNLSLVQFRKADLPDVVARTLVDAGLRPERLELEITETALIESAAECLPALRQFKALGITVVLDDFGTGYSSLSQLAMFPFDRIKIDKSFTQNMTKRSECAAIISATLTLAQSLDIQTTAEGVETVDQYRLLRLAGVSSLQGFLFKRPGPASEIDFDRSYGEMSIEQAA
jgi:diguanylate cyclase (GGDEF)-like protein/PAS domain S-box-containing protein